MATIDLLDVGDEVGGVVVLAVDGSEVGLVVAGVGGLAETLDVGLAGLPVVGVLVDLEDLVLEDRDLGERPGADRVLVGGLNRVLDVLPDMLGNDVLGDDVVEAGGEDLLEVEDDGGGVWER